MRSSCFVLEALMQRIYHQSKGNHKIIAADFCPVLSLASKMQSLATRRSAALRPASARSRLQLRVVAAATKASFYDYEVKVRPIARSALERPDAIDACSRVRHVRGPFSHLPLRACSSPRTLQDIDGKLVKLETFKGKVCVEANEISHGPCAICNDSRPRVRSLMSPFAGGAHRQPGLAGER